MRRTAWTGGALLLAALASGLGAAPQARGGAWSDAGVELRPSARIQIDAVAYAGGDAAVDDSAFVRTARFGLTARLPGEAFFKAELDLAEGDLEWENLYAGYRPGDHEVTVGERKVPLSLERLTSAGSLVFAERAAPVDTLTDSSRLGLYYAWRPEPGEGLGATVQGMLYTRSVNDDERDAPIGVAQRIVVHGGGAGGRMVHAGLAVSGERLDRHRTLRQRGGPEARLEGGDQRLLDTGVVQGVTEVVTGGVEAALQTASFTAHAEYLEKRVEREGGGALRFPGWYAQVSWRPGGTPLAYDGSRFGSPEAGHGNGKPWEWLVRFSHLDLSDDPVSGGRQDSITVGVNLRPSAHVVYKLNVIRHRIRESDAEVRGELVGAEDATVVLLRAQFSL